MQAELHTPPWKSLKGIGLAVENRQRVHYQSSPRDMIEQTLEHGQGVLNDSGALVIRTGAFTGRSPKDRYIVRDEITADAVDWNDINQPFSSVHFERLTKRITRYLADKELWVRDCQACADPRYGLNLRVVTELPWAGLFCYNMFLRPDEHTLESFKPGWTLLHAPGFEADPLTEGTRRGNFTVISFSRKLVLIGGSAYTGEIKKGIFSVLNFLLPREHGVLSMHCSANAGRRGDTALFFGLSGTGKTTLSADAGRYLIGDDEHGWSRDGIFNFEGGCYAKCINLCRESEPQIFQAIREGALLENVRFHQGSKRIDFSDQQITENTRVSYPIHFLKHIRKPSAGRSPGHIFLLTCDAYGVLPPIARLSPAQAMYQFISGYTAKVAGTETGVTEPRATFSACFGAPFLPLHPTRYARMLGEKMQAARTKCWLVNTGWTGGPFGTGKRISLTYTRALISAALSGGLDRIPCRTDQIFQMEVPMQCPGVPDQILDPRNTWADPEAFDRQAALLADMFTDNFRRFRDLADAAVRDAGPRTNWLAPSQRPA